MLAGDFAVRLAEGFKKPCLLLRTDANATILNRKNQLRLILYCLGTDMQLNTTPFSEFDGITQQVG